MTRRRALTAAASCALALLTGAALAVPAGATVPTPTPPRTYGAAIEGFAPDQAQYFCRTSVMPGVKAFESVLTSTYAGTAIISDLRACDSEAGSSEHKDGRAIDWGVDHRTATGLADGNALLSWLFATDAYGNKDAMLRRLGIMYIIWNSQIWGTWDQKWAPYSCSGVTACHIDHMHFSFGWAGAEQKTSYWTGVVSPVLPPLMPALSTVGSQQSFSVSATQASVTAPVQLPAGGTYHVIATGLWHSRPSAASASDANCALTSTGTWAVTHALSVNGHSAWAAHPQSTRSPGCNDTTHVYTLSFAVPAGQDVPLTATIADSNRADDSGTLVLTVVRTA